MSSQSCFVCRGEVVTPPHTHCLVYELCDHCIRNLKDDCVAIVETLHFTENGKENNEEILTTGNFRFVSEDFALTQFPYIPKDEITNEVLVKFITVRPEVFEYIQNQFH